MAKAKTLEDQPRDVDPLLGITDPSDDSLYKLSAYERYFGKRPLEQRDPMIRVTDVKTEEPYVIPGSRIGTKDERAYRQPTGIPSILADAKREKRSLIEIQNEIDSEKGEDTPSDNNFVAPENIISGSYTPLLSEDQGEYIKSGSYDKEPVSTVNLLKSVVRGPVDVVDWASYGLDFAAKILKTSPSTVASLFGGKALRVYEDFWDFFDLGNIDERQEYEYFEKQPSVLTDIKTWAIENSFGDGRSELNTFKHLEKVWSRYDELIFANQIPEFADTFLGPMKDILAIPPEENRDLYFAVTMGVSSLLPLAGTVGGVQRIKLFTGNMGRGAKVYQLLRKPPTSKTDFPELQSKHRMSVLESFKLAFEEFRQFRPSYGRDVKKLAKLSDAELELKRATEAFDKHIAESKDNYGNLIARRKLQKRVEQAEKEVVKAKDKAKEGLDMQYLLHGFEDLMNPNLKKALDARDAIHKITKRDSKLTLKQKRDMNVSTANNAWMGVGFGTGYALASSIPAFEENEIAKVLFGMMGGMPIGWRKKQAKKLMTEGRISFKPSKSNLVQKIYNASSTATGQLGLVFLSKVPVSYLLKTFRGDPDALIKTLTDPSHNPFTKTLISMGFKHRPGEIVKVIREGKKISYNAFYKHKLLNDEIEDLNKRIIKNTARLQGGDFVTQFQKQIDIDTDKINKLRKEKAGFEKINLQNKVLRQDSSGKIVPNSLHLMDRLMLVPRGAAEGAGAIATAIKSSDPKFEETLGLTIKALDNIAVETGLGIDDLSLTIGQATHAMVYSQYVEGSLNSARVSLMESGFSKDVNLITMINNEIRAHQENLSNSIASLGGLLRKMTHNFDRETASKETIEFYDSMKGIKDYFTQTSVNFEKYREGLRIASNQSANNRTTELAGKLVDESQEFYRVSSSQLQNTNSTIFQSNFQNFRNSRNTLYEDAKHSLNNTVNADGNLSPFYISFNPLKTFSKEPNEIFRNSEAEIFNSVLENGFYRNKKIPNLNPKNLSEDMILHGLVSGDLKKLKDIKHFKLIEDNILLPYFNRLNELGVDNPNVLENISDSFNAIYKNADGSNSTRKQAYKKAVQYLMKQNMDEGQVASQFIPRSIPVGLLLDMKRKLSTESYKILGKSRITPEERDLGNYLKSKADNIDVEIKQEIENVRKIDRKLAENMDKAYKKIETANEYMAKHANHFYGGKVTIDGEEFSAIGSPLNVIWKYYNPKHAFNELDATEVAKEFIKAKNPKLAKHQFDLVAQKYNKDTGQVYYDEKIVEHMILSLGKNQNTEDIKNFTEWFDVIVENIEGSVSARFAGDAINSPEARKALSTTAELRKHYKNYVDWNNSVLLNNKTNPLGLINEADSKAIALTLDFMKKMERGVSRSFESGPLRDFTVPKTTDELVDLVLNTSPVTSRNLAQLKKEFPELFEEELQDALSTAGTAKKVDPVITTELREIQKKATYEGKISRLDFLLASLKQAVKRGELTQIEFGETKEFLKRVVVEKLYKNAMTRVPSSRLIDKSHDFKILRDEWFETVPRGQSFTPKDFENWLIKEKGFTKRYFEKEIDLEKKFQIESYSEFLEDHKIALKELVPENELELINDIFTISQGLEAGIGAPQIANIAAGKYTEQMAAGRLYNAMKGVVSYRYLFMEAGFMKAASAQQGVIASILSNPEMTRAVHTLLHKGVWDDKSFDIIWKVLISNLFRVGITHITMTKKDYEDRIRDEQDKMIKNDK